MEPVQPAAVLAGVIVVASMLSAELGISVALLGARLTALAVEGGLPAYAATAGEVEEVKREKDEYFRGVLARARAASEARGVEVHTELVAGHAAELIAHYARAHAHDLIVIGHRGHILGDYLLGSTADRVAHHAHCPVMVVR